MREQYPEDRRYMTHEERAAEDPRYRRRGNGPRVGVARHCRCGKTSWAPGSGAEGCPQCGDKRPR